MPRTLPDRIRSLQEQEATMRALISMVGLAAEFSATRCDGSAADILAMMGIVSVLAGLAGIEPVQWLAHHLIGGELPDSLAGHVLQPGEELTETDVASAGL